MKRSSFKRYGICGLIAAALLLVSSASALAQLSTFTYQGRLQNNGAPANGTYDFKFKLFDSPTGGLQLPPVTPATPGGAITSIQSGVQVTNGAFSVQLNFTSLAFGDFARYLEITVKLSSDPDSSYVTLSPRQIITATPNAIRSISAGSADRLGNVAADQYVLTSDSRLTDARTPTAGSTNYIQNQNAALQNASFNIFGNGRVSGTLAGHLVDVNEYDLDGSRFLSAPNGNTFLGLNTYYDGTDPGSNNSYFGNHAGPNILSLGGSSNSFFGAGSGDVNSGSQNTFLGFVTGHENGDGSNNTLIGALANVGAPDLNYATAIGANSVAHASHTIVLGTNAEMTNIPGNFTVVGNLATSQAQMNLLSASGNANFYLQGSGVTHGINFGVFSGTPSSKLLISQYDGTTYQDRLILNELGTISVTHLGSAGATTLCLNSINGGEISTCSSSLRYKSNVATFAGGMNIVNRLRPITFDWKQGGAHDLGFGAEEVAKVEPLLTFKNDKGEIEGVKYSQLSAVFVNAFKEQQAQVTQQQKQITQQQDLIRQQQLKFKTEQEQINSQQQQINALKRIVCSSHRRASLCK